MWTLAEIRAAVAAMTAEQKRTAMITEVNHSDDALLGRLFRIFAMGIIGTYTYTEVYESTKVDGTFRTDEDRIVAARLLRYYTAR
jgi:hypothetical protein